MFLTFLSVSFGAVCLAGADTLEGALRESWQYLDLDVLDRDPLNALLQLHSQPPLMNLLAWLAGWVPGGRYQALVFLNCAFIAFAAMVIHEVSRAWGAARGLALLLAGAYLVSPAALLYAAYPLYPAPTTAAYALLVLGAHTARRSPRRGLVMSVAGCLFLGLLRSSFTPVHVVLVLTSHIFLTRTRMNPARVTSVLAVCIALLAPLHVKNGVLYGFVGTSSWAPLNLAKGLQVPLRLGHFPTPELIAQELPELRCQSRLGAADSALRKEDGDVNFNHCLYPAYSATVLPEILVGFDAERYLRAVAGNFAAYFSLPDRYPLLTNREAVATYADAYDVIFLPLVTLGDGNAIRLTIVALLAFAFVMALTRPAVVPRFALLLVAIHFMTHVLTDGEESGRFVFDLEFVFFLLVAFVLAAVREGSGRAAAG